jgi:hypothetical protein
MPNSERGTCRAAILTRIEAHLSVIRNLESERNTLLCFNILSDELLVNIFSCLELGPSELELASAASMGFLRQDDAVPPWLLVSQVCVRWRRVAFASLELNRCIDMKHDMRWTTQMIERASVQPGFGLSVRLARAPWSATRLFATVLQNHHQKIEHIELTCGASQVEIFHRFFTASPRTGPEREREQDTQIDTNSDASNGGNGYRFDVLKRLDLRGPQSTLYSLPATLPAFIIPSLKQLYLHNVVLGPQFPPDLLGQLSILDLTHDLGSKLPLKILLEHMAHARLIERLALCLTVPVTGKWDYEDIIGVGVISFRSLRTLELEAPGEYLSQLLGAIHAPVARVIELRSTAWINEEERVTPLLEDQLSEASGSGVQGVHIVRLAGQVWDIMCAFHARYMFLGHMSILNTPHVARVDWTSANGARLSLVTDHPLGPITMRHIQAIHGALDEAIVTLHVASEPVPQPTSGIVAARNQPMVGVGRLPSMKGLVSLSLAYQDGAAFLAWMASESGIGAVPFPKLRKLSIHEIRYSSLMDDLGQWIEDITELGVVEFRELVVTGYGGRENESCVQGKNSDEILGVLISLLEMYVNAKDGRRMEFMWEWKVVEEWNT